MQSRYTLLWLHALRALSRRVVVGTPYSAEETFTKVQTLADGARITTHANSTWKIYRDSAGQTRIEEPLPGAARAGGESQEGARTVAGINDPAAYVMYTLDIAGKVAHQQAIAAPKAKMPVGRAPAAEPNPPRPVLDDHACEGLKITLDYGRRANLTGVRATIRLSR